MDWLDGVDGDTLEDFYERFYALLEHEAVAQTTLALCGKIGVPSTDEEREGWFKGLACIGFYGLVISCIERMMHRFHERGLEVAGKVEEVVKSLPDVIRMHLMMEARDG